MTGLLRLYTDKGSVLGVTRKMFEHASSAREDLQHQAVKKKLVRIWILVLHFGLSSS